MLEVVLVISVFVVLFYLCIKSLHDCDLDYEGLVFVVSMIAACLIFTMASTLLGV
jgi:hypothetical protein